MPPRDPHEQHARALGADDALWKLVQLPKLMRLREPLPGERSE